jgi:hypothetical protein
VKIVVAVILLVDAWEEARFLTARMGRAANGWWRRAEHRERRLLHEGEAGFLFRLFDRR